MKCRELKVLFVISTNGQREDLTVYEDSVQAKKLRNLDFFLFGWFIIFVITARK